MSLMIGKVGICITLHNCCLQLALFRYQRPAFQLIPINLIDTLGTLTTGRHIHQNIQIPQQSFHHMPYSMLTNT